MRKLALPTLWLIVAGLVGACVTPPLPTAIPPQPAAAPIKLGAIYNLTGAQAPLDAPSAHGAMLAVEEINAAGGLLGRPLELTLVDGQTDTAVISAAARQLVQTEQVAALFGFSDSDQVLAAAPIAAEAGIVFVTSGATSPTLPEQAPGFVYLACFGDNVQAAAGAEYAIDTLGARTAYLLTDRGMAYTRLLAGYFAERFAELGGTIVLQDAFQTGDQDFSGQIARLQQAGAQPDLLFIASGPDDIGAIVQQFRQAGVDAPILGGDAYDTPLLLETAGQAAENTYFTTHALLDAEQGSAAVQEFIAAYQALFQAPPANAFAALGYDTVYLLADAIVRAGSADPAAIRAALAQTSDLPGVTGTITYQPGSQIPQKGVTVIRVQDGQFTLAAELTPAKVPAP